MLITADRIYLAHPVVKKKRGANVDRRLISLLSANKDGLANGPRPAGP